MAGCDFLPERWCRGDLLNELVKGAVDATALLCTALDKQAAVCIGKRCALIGRHGAFAHLVDFVAD